MTNEELNTALYEKMFAEQEQYRAWLLSQPPAEILKHTYEYTVREDILLALAHRTPHQMRIYIILLFYYTPNSGKIQGLFTKNTVFVNYVHFLCKSRYVNF